MRKQATSAIVTRYGVAATVRHAGQQMPDCIASCTVNHLRKGSCLAVRICLLGSPVRLA